MITAYNKITKQLTQVEHSWLLKPPTDWVINPIIPDQVALIHAPNDTWLYDPATTILRVATPEELDTDAVRIEKIKVEQQSKLTSAVTTAIANGFVSRATGTPHFYPNSDQERIALFSAILSSAGTSVQPAGFNMLYPCFDADADGDETGILIFVPHTNAQLKQVAVDAAAFRSAMLQKLATKKYMIDMATTVSAVQAITWES